MPLTNGIYFAEYSPPGRDNLPTLVYLHGAGASSLFWPGKLRRFGNHRTISIDLPGHGKSDPPGRQSVNHYSQIIESWLADLNLKNTILIGHGLGCSIAVQIAINYPHLAQGLVLINALFTNHISESTIHNLTNPITAQNSINHYINKTLQLRYTRPHHRALYDSLENIRPAVLAGDFMAENEKVLLKVAEQIKQPVCIIESNTGKDQFTSAHKHAVNRLPDATMVFSEQNSQLLPIDEPKWISTQIQAFLRNINGRQIAQSDSGYYLDMDINEEGNYAIRAD